ncbi:MAG TPA: 4-oxalomesaconate tautomerase [Candidatus Lambdaproteobacteria bacterium]|nr:4-oxalomesaconate tautomerase [Candidatus Lambdaproteobacteria bacterium]
MPEPQAIPCTWMRGGTSKGAFFLQEDLPTEIAERDALLLSVLGSPDPRQIDGIGGADPLTSKVAMVSRSMREGVDVDYLFLQVFVDQPIVTDTQNCGNILSGVAQFAAEKKLIKLDEGSTDVKVYLVNSAQVATVTIQTPGRAVTYAGDACIDGVPGRAAPVLQNFPEASGSSCGALLPTGNAVDVIDGVEVTCIDNGMPVVVLRAEDLGISGSESREELDGNEALKQKLESIRLQVGPLMNLGDVWEKSVPKMTLVSPPSNGGAITTRTFIPHRCHASIGVLGAVSVATACMFTESPAGQLAELPEGAELTVSVEHPLGETSVIMDVCWKGGTPNVRKAAILRTARKLFEGVVYFDNLDGCN